MKRNTIFKILFAIGLLLFVVVSVPTEYTNKLFAALTLVFSIAFLIKSRKSPPITLIALFMLYCNYSIIMGEYFIVGDLGAPMYQVKTIYVYGILIKTLFLLTAYITIFYKAQTLDLSRFKLIPKDNVVIFYSLILVLTYISIFGVVRGSMESYSVSITPMYEYSTLLFLFAYYFSGKSSLRKSIIAGLLILFVLQDFYYGGRVTSLQLILLAAVTLGVGRLSFKNILLGGSVGIFIISLVGAYRNSFSLNSISVVDVFTNLKNDLFVFDTPVYAYYASATHIAASDIADLGTKISSLFAFVVSIFTGSNSEISNLTAFVRSNYFPSLGGGIIPSHFYFWLGWSGVIIVAILLLFVLRRIGIETNDFQKLCSLVIITTVPRWYLYTPLMLFRPLFFLALLYVVFLTSHKLLVSTFGTNKRKATHLKKRKISRAM